MGKLTIIVFSVLSLWLGCRTQSDPVADQAVKTTEEPVVDPPKAESNNDDRLTRFIILD